MFDNVKNLIGGTINTASLQEMQDAYQHFQSTPNVKVIRVTQQMDELHRVKVNYVWNDQIIGEVQFKYKVFAPELMAIEFMTELKNCC